MTELLMADHGQSFINKIVSNFYRHTLRLTCNMIVALEITLCINGTSAQLLHQ
jgi:hypothetical protein